MSATEAEALILGQTLVPEYPQQLAAQTEVVSVTPLAGDMNPGVSPLAVTAEPVIHGIVGAQFGDLEYDVGKSVRWLDFFVDDLFIMDINTGEQRYWVINWAESFPASEHAVSGRNFFYSKSEAALWRKEQFEAAAKVFHYQENDWVLFVDGHEGLSFDNRSLPDDYNAQPFMSWMYREIARAVERGQTAVHLPFFVYLKYSDLQNITYATQADQGGLQMGIPPVSQAASVPWYLPAGWMPRLFQVSALRGDFDWSTLDTPVSTPPTGELSYLDATIGTITTPDPGPLPNRTVMTAKVRISSGFVTQSEYGIAQMQGSGTYGFRWMGFNGGLWYHATSDGFNFRPGTIANTGQVTAAGIVPGAEVTIAMYLNMDNGANQAAGRAYVSFNNGATWTAVGPEVVQAGALPYNIDLSLPLTIGAWSTAQNNRWQGRIYSAELRTGLDPTGVAVAGATMQFPGIVGNYLNVTPVTSVVIPADLEIVTRCVVGTGTGNNNIVVKDGSPRGWRLVATSARVFALNPFLPAAGINSTAIPVANGTMVWVKVTRVATTGLISYYWAADQATEPTSWTALNSGTGTAGAMLDSTTGVAVEVGARSAGSIEPFTGRIARVIVRNGIDASTLRAVFPNVPGNTLSVLGTGVTTNANTMEIVVRVAHPDWDAASSLDAIVWRNQSFILRRSSFRQMQWIVYYGAGLTMTSTVNYAGGIFPNNQLVWLKATLNADNGSGAWVSTIEYNLTNTPVEPTTWTALTGTLTSTPGRVISHNTQNIWLGADDPARNSRWRLARAIIRNGIAGPTVFDFNESNITAIGAASFPATTGGTVVVTQRQPVAFAFPNATGNTLGIANSAGLQITGDIEIVCRIAPTTWAFTGNYRYIFDKWNSGTTSYGIRFNNSLNSLEWLFNGTVGGPLAQQFSYTALMGNAFTDGVPVWLRFRLDVDNGSGSTVLSAEYAPDAATEPTSGWTNIVAPVTRAGLTSIITNTMAPTIYPYPGNLYRLIVRSGFAGTVGADINESNATAGATSFTATTGGTVTVTQTASNVICQVDPRTSWNSIIQGPVLDVDDSLIPNDTVTTFPARTTQTVTVNQTAGQKILQPVASQLLWKFDASEYPGTGTSYTDPRGRAWTLTAANSIHYEPSATDLKVQLISYGYAHWNLQDIPPGQTQVPALSASNDEGWKMRNLLSRIRPISGIGYGDTWLDPTTDPVSYPGPWCVDTTINVDPTLAGTVEEAGHTAPATATAGLRIPLYDHVMRLNLRDGLWYDFGVSGNIPLSWDTTNQVWKPNYTPEEWAALGTEATDVAPPAPSNLSLRLDGTAGTYARTADSPYLDYQYAFTIMAVVALDSWTTGTQTLVGKWGAAGQRSYLWQMINGQMSLLTSRDGTNNATTGLLTDYTLNFAPGQAVAIGVSFTFDITTLQDEIRFWLYDPQTLWSQVGSTKINPNPSSLAMFNSTADLQVGAANGAQLAKGLFRAVSVRSGIGEANTFGGTEVALLRGDLTGNPTYDRYGNVWANQGTGWSYVPMTNAPL